MTTRRRIEAGGRTATVESLQIEVRKRLSNVHELHVALGRIVDNKNVSFKEGEKIFDELRWEVTLLGVVIGVYFREELELFLVNHTHAEAAKHFGIAKGRVVKIIHPDRRLNAKPRKPPRVL